jgi:histidinol-phosphate aminotransferase
MHYERDDIQKLTAYAPGEQPREAHVVKLNTNENPYRPSEAVKAAIRAIDGDDLRRYPPSSAEAFRRTAAHIHGLNPDQIIATNGGDELLRLAVTVFCAPASASPSAAVGIAEPSYSLYPVLAQIHGVPMVRVALTDEFALPEDFADRVLNAGCRLVMIVNPHAPSGRLEPMERLNDLAQRLMGRAVLLIDEAYVDFAKVDALALLTDSSACDNVLLLRSLSKGYSLAGLRFGYGMGQSHVIAALNKARDSYNTDVLAQAAATAALSDRPAAQRTWKLVISQRQRMTDELTARGFHVLASQANFVLARPPALPDGDGAEGIYRKLKQKAIFVRYFNQEMLRDSLRITIGTPQQNNALLKALDQIG